MSSQEDVKITWNSPNDIYNGIVFSIRKLIKISNKDTIIKKKYLGGFDYLLKQMMWNIGWLIYEFMPSSIFKSGTLDLYYLNTSEYEYARNLSKQSESELTGYTEKN